uniref:Uncharacterized protein n=1 Tax=Physcomitrium patens TaxID=3218 RepID=A0A2K1IVN9_PHYPA|nr:hypothetical protein PHYPA_025283 [Physcomitrium patens]
MQKLLRILTKILAGSFLNPLDLSLRHPKWKGFSTSHCTHTPPPLLVEQLLLIMYLSGSSSPVRGQKVFHHVVSC